MQLLCQDTAQCHTEAKDCLHQPVSIIYCRAGSLLPPAALVDGPSPPERASPSRLGRLAAGHLEPRTALGGVSWSVGGGDAKC